MSLFPKFEISLKPPATPATTATFQPKCSGSSDCSNLLEMDSGISGVSADNFSQTPDRGKSIQEATRLYQKRGWVQIFSGYLNQSIYLAKDNRVKVPDSAIPKYTQSEVDGLKNLTLDELRTLHEAKVLFKGTIIS